jgi:hypothetical protein
VLLPLLGALQIAACSDPVLPEDTVATLEITTEFPSSLAPGETLQLQAIARDAAGLVVEDVTISWTSSDQEVATLVSTGLVTAVAEGTSTIAAAIQSVSNSAPLTVTLSSASYDVEFVSIWSASTHPVSIPSSPHFSGLIGGTHGADVTFWAAGAFASDGVLSGGNIPSSPGSVEITFDVDVDFPLVTLVSMIAPSPDWFVGVSSLSLLEEGSWASTIVVQLFAYDAGTDSGVIYTSGDQPTDPRANISRITESPFDVATPLGTFTFTFTRRAGS